MIFRSGIVDGMTLEQIERSARMLHQCDRIEIFGVIIDSIKSHQKFIEKQQLPYPLISDEQKQIVEAYGVWVEKQMYGKKYMGTERSTFVIGVDGKIEAILEKVKPAKHLEQLLELLD
jgi:peroxiredoxin Q/BCP